MDIFWLGHSCFRLKGKEAILITDPPGTEIGYKLLPQKADIVTISHEHIGHSNVSLVDGDCRIVRGPGEYEIKGVFITGIASSHDQMSGNKYGKNTIYLIEMDGVTICHLGDLGHNLSSDIIEMLGNVGVLMIPVGDVSTIDSNVASELVRAITPRIVLPMHYKTDLEKNELEPLDKFLKKMGIKDVVVQPKLSINKSTFSENTQLVVLQHPV